MPQSAPPLRTLILGGGVAGCALASALRGTPCGASVTVVERRVDAAAAGMGFLLLPNGIAALREIAPEVDWLRAGRSIVSVQLLTHAGEMLAEPAIAPSLCVSRVRFLSLLRGAVGEARWLEGVAATSLDRSHDGSFSAARLDDGASLEADAFFVCDGASSRLRAQAFPHARLSDVIVQEVVSTAHAPLLARALGSTFRKFHAADGGLAVGLLAESDEKIVWFVQFDSRRHAAPSRDAIGSFVRRVLADFAPDVQRAMDATDFTTSHLWPTRDLEPLDDIRVRNLALVGDAAHACLPFTSQGANGALEDAAALKRLLSRATTDAEIEAELARYSAHGRQQRHRVFAEGRRLREAFLQPLAAAMPAIPLVS